MTSMHTILIRPALLCLGAVFLVLGCQSDTKQPAEAYGCTYDDAPTQKAPDWICDGRLESGPIFQAVGFSKIYGGDISSAKDTAVLNARADLASRMGTDIRQLIQNMGEQHVATKSQGISSSRVSGLSSSNEIRKRISDEFIAGRLVGSYVMKRRRSPGDFYYVLVGMDQDHTAHIVQDALKAAEQVDPQLQGLEDNLEDAIRRLGAQARDKSS